MKTWAALLSHTFLEKRTIYNFLRACLEATVCCSPNKYYFTLLVYMVHMCILIARYSDVNIRCQL